MSVTYFRPQRSGPEAVIEDAVANQIPNLFPSENHSLWAAGSLPIGAGMPDLVVVSCKPQVFALAQVEIPTIHILAYLRTVGSASLGTIIDRTGMSKNTAVCYLNSLIEVEAVLRDNGAYSLLPTWREILPEVITIEVKVKKWKRAVEQAARNHIFAHRSFVALPDYVAQRVRLEPILRLLGIGLLSISDDYAVRILRRSRHRKPRVWKYYYEIASLVARHYKD